MIIIIQNADNLNLFNNQAFIELKDICQIKTFKEEPYTILLLNTKIADDGMVENFNFFFEEILITLSVVAVMTNTKSDKLREVCNFHQISLLEF